MLDGSPRKAAPTGGAGVVGVNLFRDAWGWERRKVVRGIGFQE
ncbi:hypothetical protein PPEP_b0096 [Pseudoalteromonas peptidolytica F12-50-A1]|uniref:Uncharacterized protein n=1 Tax=Pseudoalteromonas peptidolytica F12-50-A1 TaxID=1315280 RepID=A0A8I0MYR4_9GAMM|nr:hypothetical protein [Pseudoalteromonas peptidolytica F12-50-A1]